jgi:hypothetical protein
VSLAPAEAADLPPATETGGLIVAASDALGSRVRYRARIVVTADTARPQISRIRTRREGGRTVLSLSVSEAARVDGCIEPVLKRGEFHSIRTAPLFRFLRGGQVAPGESTIALGAIPARRYRADLRARDRNGNTTYVNRVITGPPAAG